METWGMEETVALLVLVGLVGLSVGVGKAPRLLRFIFLTRYSLGLALAVASLPLVAAWGPNGVQRLLRNLYALGPFDLFVVTLLATLATWVAMATGDLTVRYAPYRFGGGAAPAPGNWLTRWVAAAWRRRFFVAMALTLPTVAAGWVVSPRDQLRPVAAVAAVLLGWLAALSMLLTAATLQLLWRGDGRNYPADTLLLPAGTPGRHKLVAAVETLARLAGKVGLRRRPRSNAAPDWPDDPYVAEGEPPGLLWAGYKTQDGRWLEGHLTSAVFCTLTVLLYATGYKLLHPDAGPFNDFPSLGYVLFILLFFGWLLPGFAFFLDRYRVPPSLVVLALSYLLSTSLSYLVPASDHTWSVEAAPVRHDGETEEAAGEVERVSGAICPRPREGEPARRPEVYVAASGGGITASVWTARVLAGLQCEAGEGFTSSLELISSVSGGSVGTLHYVDRWRDGRPPSTAALDVLVDASGASSLDAIAWGLAYPDLWRAAGFPLYLIDPKVDRGWALERAWRDALDHRHAALSAWRGEVAADRLPGVVFNATVAEVEPESVVTGTVTVTGVVPGVARPGERADPREAGRQAGRGHHVDVAPREAGLEILPAQ
ncbi:MAG TPA: hypothetical protein VKU40_01445, partial [Thermoanaerobaculia bacterium]|nr:hypothetical protein [Thermoanaerobaculia bacterium]